MHYINPKLSDDMASITKAQTNRKHSFSTWLCSVLPRRNGARWLITLENMGTLATFLGSVILYWHYWSQICGDMGPINKIIWDIPDFTVLNGPIFRSRHKTGSGIWKTANDLLRVFTLQASVLFRNRVRSLSMPLPWIYTSWDPSQYKGRLSQEWGFPC